MGEWFKEFQVACAKSETVMQKKKASKTTGRHNSGNSSSSGGGRSAISNVLDDVSFDSIRYCDTVAPAVAHKSVSQDASSSSSPSALQVKAKEEHEGRILLPPSLTENLPLSELYGESVSV